MSSKNPQSKISKYCHWFFGFVQLFLKTLASDGNKNFYRVVAEYTVDYSPTGNGNLEISQCYWLAHDSHVVWSGKFSNMVYKETALCKWD